MIHMCNLLDNVLERNFVQLLKTCVKNHYGHQTEHLAYNDDSTND